MAEICKICKYIPCTCSGEEDVPQGVVDRDNYGEDLNSIGEEDLDSSSEDLATEETDWEEALSRYTLEQQIQLTGTYNRHLKAKLKIANVRHLKRYPALRDPENVRRFCNPGMKVRRKLSFVPDPAEPYVEKGEEWV